MQLKGAHPLRVEDYAAWSKLWQGYLTFYGTELAQEVTDLTWARFFDDTEPLHCLGAYEDDTLVGFASFVFHRSTWATTTYCYLEDLFVDASQRCKGTGRVLIEGVAEAAKQAGAERLYWATQDDNHKAQALYDRVATKTDFLQYRKPL